MLTRDAIEEFGSGAALARALRAAGYDCTRQAVAQWGDAVPELQARRLEEITGGRLRWRRAEEEST